MGKTLKIVILPLKIFNLEKCKILSDQKQFDSKKKRRENLEKIQN
jgi:hypothetical protein